MSFTVQRKAAQYEDVLSAPEHLVAEILDGELFTSPRPAVRHARAASILGADLVSQFDGPGGEGESPGGLWFLYEPELHFDDDVVVPDIAGWRRECVPELPDVAWFDVAPDWLCEVISPSTESIDRGRKLRIYAREGVSHVWLLNPVVKLLEVYRLTEGNWILVKTAVGDDAVRAEPFDAIEMEMSRWWLPEALPSSEA
ncbi:MAG: Uma2 family endonuclease [Acidobacteria bacterium]|nr:MAG: Uma2 family endonuclease [Acidobacteriota bacterium]